MALGTPRQRSSAARAAGWLIAVHGFSSFCYGLVYPYTAIYLADRPGVGTGGVALYYGVSGAANLAVALVLASGFVRLPRIALAVAGNLLSSVGYVALAFVSGLAAVGLAAAATGIGQGCFLAAIIPIVNSLVHADERRRVFARRYQVLNGTLAAGSLVAGLIASALSRDAIRYFILVNAAGYLPLVATLLLYRSTARAGEQARSVGQATGDGRGLSIGLLMKASLAVAVFQFGVYLVGYSQFEVTSPLVVDKLMHAPLAWVSVLIAVNVVVIVIAQSAVTRLLEPRPVVFGLRAAVALWVGGYVLAGATAVIPMPGPLAGLLAFAVLFALGECAYSCSYHPWLISRVPEQDLTRANAFSNSMMGIGMFAGPAIGVGLVGTGNAPLVWLALAALCVTVGLTTVRLRRPVGSGRSSEASA